MATSDVLIKYGPIGVQILRTNVQRVSTTGKTAESIRFVVDTLNNRLQILGRGYFAALETGRGPRTKSTYGEFDKHLEDWMNAKGFPTKVSKSGTKYYLLGNQWFSAKSMAWKINKTGDKMWRQGHGQIVRDVFTSAMADFVDLLIKEVEKDKFETFRSKVRDSLKDIGKAA